MTPEVSTALIAGVVAVITAAIVNIAPMLVALKGLRKTDENTEITRGIAAKTDAIDQQTNGTLAALRTELATKDAALEAQTAKNRELHALLVQLLAKTGEKP